MLGHGCRPDTLGKQWTCSKPAVNSQTTGRTAATNTTTQRVPTTQQLATAATTLSHSTYLFLFFFFFHYHYYHHHHYHHYYHHHHYYHYHHHYYYLDSHQAIKVQLLLSSTSVHPLVVSGREAGQNLSNSPRYVRTFEQISTDFERCLITGAQCITNCSTHRLLEESCTCTENFLSRK